jgi:hypothetical protein
MINTIRPIVQSGKEEKMKIREQGEDKAIKERELEKRRNPLKMTQSAYLIACEVHGQSNRSIVN